MEKATFSAGCFWHVQYVFDCVPGVVKTTAGYIGGKTYAGKEVKYNEVEEKGFAEAVEIQFDGKKVQYEKLLEYFWREHDPTSLNRQGADFGRRYRSAIFYHSEKQREKALASLKKEQKRHKERIVTEITPATKFYPAEEEHQKYLEKNG